MVEQDLKMMRWGNLLSLKRFGDTHKRLRTEQDESRLGFEVDYDRIIFSSEFRSLQDKTQVIPLSKTDFVHTRLTHSLEVSVVGRSLGRQVGKEVITKHPHLSETMGYKSNDFGAIVAAACLAHDIGNPPFGHSGEKAIGEFFKNGHGQQFKDQLTELQYLDLCHFEGNANGFKILTENRIGRIGGLRLSYATLGAFMKYPKESYRVKQPNHIAEKKYGFFQSERDAFLDVASELKLLKRSADGFVSFNRHPLAYLVEAADDICYTIIDFEDGINLGLIDEELALEYLIKLVSDTINREKYYGLKQKRDRVSYLRALAINTLINEAVNIFMSNEEEILSGQYKTSLMDASRYKAQIDDIIKVSIDKVYQSPEVIHKEIAGYEILQGLLKTFIGAVYNYSNNTASNYDKLILRLLEPHIDNFSQDFYVNAINICNYISKLSDSNAILTYNHIKGNSIA